MNSAVKATPIILTISQLTKAIKLHLENAFRFVMVKGEVSNLKTQASGHTYFTLKDESAQITCVLFSQDAKKLAALPKMGDKITIKGELTVYEARGNYQIIVREINQEGLGEQLQRLEELKNALKAKGYFDPARKKQIPKFPKTIGVVTSETGAVIRDIIQVLTRRLHGFHLILNPVRVQGEGAAEEIALAIRQFNQYQLADVIIVGRGGGSFEELSCFNDIRVATAIFESKIPIVSAVGHETDVTIADFVADLRAPTPSAAAEIISQEKLKLLEQLEKYRLTLYQRAVQQLRHKQELFLRVNKHPLFQTSDYLTKEYAQRVDDLREDVELAIKQIVRSKKELLTQTGKAVQALSPKVMISNNQEKLAAYQQAVELAMKNIVKIRKERCIALQQHLDSVNPRNVLKKGYSIVFSEKDNCVISSVRSLHEQDSIAIQFVDGSLKAQVSSVQINSIKGE